MELEVPRRQVNEAESCHLKSAPGGRRRQRVDTTLTPQLARVSS